MKKYLRKAIYFLFFPFLWVACFNKSIKAGHIFVQVERLEREEKYKEARRLGKTWLLKLPIKYTAPLWRQEGNDLLYKMDNYERSLKAYENALKSLEENPSNWGVANPIQIYYGATISCLKLDLKDKARKYFQKFLPMYESYSQNIALKDSVTKYDDGVAWIRKNLIYEIKKNG